MKNIFGKVKSVEEAMAYINDGCSIMYGGFGGVGTSPLLIEGIVKKNVKNLTIIGNDTAYEDVGIGRIVSNNQVRKAIVSHIGVNRKTIQLVNDGEIQVEFVPQGTLAERIRAKGVGLAGIITDVGKNTEVEIGKKKVIIEGKEFFVENAMGADVGIVYARKADSFGNLVFDKAAKNYNPLVAMAADVTLVQAEELVGWGEIDPERVDVSGIFVDVIVCGEGGRWIWNWQKDK